MQPITKKTNFILTVLLIILFSPFITKAQANYQDVVHLKNGSIVHGTIIEQVPNQTIKIQTRDGNVFVYKIEEIEKMTKEQVKNSKIYNINSNNDEITQYGYINITEINFCPGMGHDIYQEGSDFIIRHVDYSSGFRIVNGYQLNEYISLGIGIGIDKHINATLLPITLDARATILEGKVSPVFTANIGYSIGLTEYIKGGLVINPQIGIKAYISNTVAYLFNIGYMWQSKDVKFYYEKEKKEFYQFITISTGFAF